MLSALWAIKESECKKKKKKKIEKRKNPLRTKEN
jgi:hypothetical protein